MQRFLCVAILIAAISVQVVANADEAAPAAPPQPAPAAPAAQPASSVHRVPPDEAEAILGRQVTDLTGKDLGRLVDILVDEDGQPQAAVIDFGGFLGVGSRKVAVHWSTLHFNPAEGKHLITLDMTPDQIKAAPEYTNPDKPAPVVTPAGVPPVTH